MKFGLGTNPYTDEVYPFGLFQLAAFLIGLLFGSFLNVCISRLPQRESVVHPRSRCPKCKTPIRWYDNIPLLSWVFLRGSCHDCKTRIPLRYPLVELATGIWFAIITFQVFVSSLIGIYVQLSTEWWAIQILTGLGLVILGFLLIGLMVMDWQTMILPTPLPLAA